MQNVFRNGACAQSRHVHQQLGDRVSKLVSSGDYYQALKLFEKEQDNARLSRAVILRLLKACASLGLVVQGRYLHNIIITHGLSSDCITGNTLIDMYGKCGALHEAHSVFESLPDRSVVSWSALISSYVLRGHSPKAIELFKTMHFHDVAPSKSVFLSTLKACGNTSNIDLGRVLHDHTIRGGQITNAMVGSSVLDMYAKCGSVDEADKMFHLLESPDVVSWNALLAGYCQHEQGHKALVLFQEMQQRCIKPTIGTFVSILKACGDTSSLEQGKLIHDKIIRQYCQIDEVLVSSLISMYSEFGRFVEATKLFRKGTFHGKNLLGVMIAGYVKHGEDVGALKLVQEMQGSFGSFDNATYLSILKACGNLKALTEGMIIQDKIIRNAEYWDVVLGSAVIDMYCKCGDLEAAHAMFDKLPNKNVVSWGAIIAGCADSGFGLTVLAHYDCMEINGIPPNRAVLLSVLKACRDLVEIGKGMLLHNRILALGLDSDTSVGSSLIDMYTHCGNVDEAYFCFQRIYFKDIVCWNVMIAGCVNHKSEHLALDIFQKMLDEGVEPDSVTYICIFQACARLGAKSYGQIVHSIFINSRFSNDTPIETNVIDMYAKCGSVDEAHNVLSLVQNPDLAAWTSVISGYAEVGNCEMVNKCFESMLQQGMYPDAQTFTSLLSACNRAGEVSKGQKQLEAMQQEYGIKPGIEHYNCMIGLLANGGCLEEAIKMVNSMPISPDMTSWMSLIIACRNYGSYLLAKKCFNKAVQLDPNVASGYVLMSNIYNDMNLNVDNCI